MRCKYKNNLNKNSLLELVGTKIQKNKPIYLIEEQEQQKILDKYNEFGKDIKATATYFGTTISRIESKLNKKITNESYEEYTSKTREYLEKNKNWEIKSFDPSAKEVCVSMKKTNVVFSFDLSNAKYS